MYGEKRISVDGEPSATGEKTKTEYRVWNPFRSKLAACILGGVDAIHMKPGSKVLYLGAASGTSVSHVSDIVGPVIIIYYTYDALIFFFREKLPHRSVGIRHYMELTFAVGLE